MANLGRDSKNNRIVNCNLILMALLFTLFGSFGIIGGFIISLAYAFYTNYWKPIAAFITLVIIVFLLIYITIYFTDLRSEKASIIGWVLGLTPSILSFFLYRSRILFTRNKVKSIEG